MRALTDAELDRLDLFMCHQDNDDVMMLSELDGYLTGVLVCPDLILPGEWMPVIWGEAGPAFADHDEAREILGLIMELSNDIAGGLQHPKSYGPLIEEDIDGTFLWEFWAQGFGKALSLRPEVWSRFDARPDDDPAALAFRRLASLAVIARATDEDPDLYDEMDEGLMRDAPDMIVPCVLALHADRIANHGAAPGAGKTGRNDSCPCGSGKKYKKCCLQAQN